jgi:hypothetical protein
MSDSETTRLVRFYDHDGHEVGQPVYAVGREVDGRHEEHYAHAAQARNEWQAMQARLKALDEWATPPVEDYGDRYDEIRERERDEDGSR